MTIRLIPRFHCDAEHCLETMTNESTDDVQEAIQSLLSGPGAWTLTTDGQLLCSDDFGVHERSDVGNG
jgi:hypothetical protein